MLKTLAVIAVVLAVIVAGILIYAATKLDSFTVKRTAAIKAPPERIFALIDDLHGWAAWSPYEKKDPGMKRTFGGAAMGKGAIYQWDGNKNVGSGSMEIIEAIQPSKIVIKLDFLKPFQGHNTAEFTMVPVGDNTDVTWAMYGPSSYMFKVMGIFMDMDKMIGDDFTAGLANLKAVAER
jgi:uncharacterized protein YndB with AHSA1/START domain